MSTLIGSNRGSKPLPAQLSKRHIVNEGLLKPSIVMEETELRQRITEPSESSIEDVIPVRSKTSSITKHHEGFQTLCVMEFAVGTPAFTTEWLLSKIQASRNDSGGELQAELVQDDTGKPATIHVGATTERLLIAAELMELKKPYHDGSLREVSVGDLKNFQNTDDLDAFLLMAEKQRIVLHEMKLIRAPEDDLEIPGFDELKLYPGEVIIPKCLNNGIIVKLFPLHDKEELKRLEKEWYFTVINIQPLDKIREYFGETVAMYFAFLGFYMMALIPPAFMGFLTLLLTWQHVTMQVSFCVMNLIWATVFLEMWKRYAATLAYKWGSLGEMKFEAARAEYYGSLGTNAITGRLEPKYPKRKAGGEILRWICSCCRVMSASGCHDHARVFSCPGHG
ncbi:Anoctamin-10 [Lamellibrachia satsuma]|nr:Anoctamin-10 [Lamellibrachia satsuma]